jgi:acyl-CoA synthetase (AMP-forming)/AMP-acid ligase II
LLALWWRGAVAVFADAWTTRNRMSLVAESVGPKLLVAIPIALLLRATSPALRALPAEILWPWHGLPQASGAPEPSDVDAESSALVTFTTGSSGNPKGADRTHRFLLAQHQALARALGEIPAGPDLVTLPIFALHALAGGRTCQLAPITHSKPSRYNPKRLLKDIERYQPTSATASPAVFETLLDHLERTSTQVRARMHLHAGGAAVTPGFMQRMRSAFPNAKLTAVYGSTEAEPIAMLDGDRLARQTPSRGLAVGTPFSGTHVNIVPAGLTAIPACSAEKWRRLGLGAGEVGEICVAGDHVLTRYYDNALADAQHKVCVDGVVWHRTGDAGCWQVDGTLDMFGSLSQSFSWAGNDWYPLPLELQLDALDGVEKSTVICGPSGPIVCLEPKAAANDDDLELAVRSLELPFSWTLWVGSIPRDPRHNSKIDHQKLRCMARGVA